MSHSQVRVRFAPSPTGPLHIGGVRTALYNYLFAKKNNGTFIIRIEDTDQTRFVRGAQDYILDALKWCGITPEEGPEIGGKYGPYIQSERRDIYRPYADALVASENAYYAFDTPEELEKVRLQAKNMGMPNWQYNAVSRQSMSNSLTLPADEVKRRLTRGDAYVIRFKMPRNKEVRFEDAIRGWVVVNTNHLDDKVLFKSDGMPTYHLANIVDDYLMKISHVIRGEEWLPSAPLHVLLYEAFNWEKPQFAHLPLLLRPDGKGKLSKRDGDKLGFPVFPCNWTTQDGELYSGYRETGYLPQAVVNMLALLGWNPGTPQELFSLQELEQQFSLERVAKSGAKFDPDKTRWFQQQHLKNVPDKQLAQQLLDSENIHIELDQLTQIVALMKERAVFPKDILTQGEYLIQAPQKYDPITVTKKWNEQAKQLMSEWREYVEKIDDFSRITIEENFRSFIGSKQLGLGAVLPLFRLVLTGESSGPNLFEIAAFLGKQEVVDRINKGLNTIPV